MKPDPDGERALVSFAEHARVSASERVRRARRRSLWLGCVIVALLAIAPLLMAIVRHTTGQVAPAPSADLVRDASAKGASRAAVSRAPVVTDALDAATHSRMDLVRRATEQLLEGDSASALTAFRTLSRTHPEHLALGHVVRSLEQQLRACAQDVAACR
ncbi:MAG: hypothetical protein ABW252_19795 [Polyangiales bacterium]